MLALHDYNQKFDNIDDRMLYGWVMVGTDILITVTFAFNLLFLVFKFLWTAKNTLKKIKVR